jgi:anti-sigma B factor antagonist
LPCSSCTARELASTDVVRCGVVADLEDAAITIQDRLPRIENPLDTAGFSVVRLPAEVDLSNASDVLDGLLSTINRGGTHLIVDARAVRFMDSSALNALLRARRRTEAMNGSLHVVAPGHRLRRLLEISRLDSILRRVDSVENAVACVSSPTGQHLCSEVQPPRLRSPRT